MFDDTKDRKATNVKLTNVKSPMHNRQIIPAHHTVHNEHVTNGIFMSSAFKLLYFPSNLDATNFFTNVKNPETSTMKQITNVNNNKFSSVFIGIL